MKYLTKSQILDINNIITKKTGGYCGNIRDNNAFETSYYSPFVTFSGVDMYSDDTSKIAKACYSFISNHPFTDGNKRIGIHILLLLLKLNGYDIKFETNELVNIAMAVAQNKMNVEDIIQIINNKI